MKVWQKLAGFLLGLAVVFAVAVGIGRTLGPNMATAEQDAASDELPGGLMSAQGGYTLELAQTRVNASKDVPLRFRITDSSGTPVTRYVDSHEKQLHLIVVRRDMAGFQHVHPVLDGDGTWSVPVDLSSAGDYRVFADFVPAGGQALTLGADVHVAGRYDPQQLPPAATTTTVDGYTVTLSGNPKANESSMLTLSVSRNGKPVTDLQPYLGAYGHLVALRESDLAYLHVHPMGEPGDGVTPSGPEIGFHTTLPNAGNYRLFLDFRHNDVVRTAEFTVSVGATGSAQPTPVGHGH
ncbi:MAG: hypothetical protein ACJ74F_07040 [Mycobacterium sp.]|jgi:hypothetical protein|uniref:hypothetical protein n=1 Tax=Mycobacterium sp. TaxID=1785 RepID=UPI00389AF363